MFRKQFLSLALAALALVVSSVASAGEKKASKPAKNPVVVMKTSMGAIKIELDPAKAPISVENFLKYVDDKYYDGTAFHRVISTFMVQGGGFDKNTVEKKAGLREPIKNESKNGLKNVRGSLAMARTSVPDSATAQFYINVVDNANLDFPSFDGVGYAVFGKVIDGMDVVDKIKSVKTGTKNGMGDVPVEPVMIESVRRE